MVPAVPLKANDRIVFIGDSITSADRHRRTYAPLGYGYVHFIGNLLMARHPELDLRIINTGISGNTVIDLKHRWQKDCLAHRPNVLSVLIGINDVWQLTMEPASARTASTADRYELTYDQLLAEARERCGCRLVLMEPFLFCRDPYSEVLQALTPYLEIVRRLASKYQAALVPLQAQIDRLIREVPPDRWSADTVHPYLWAHAWIAQQWLQAAGLRGDVTG
jgi:lysophospholipase L1-like esterase